MEKAWKVTSQSYEDVEYTSRPAAVSRARDILADDPTEEVVIWVTEGVFRAGPTPVIYTEAVVLPEAA